MNKLNSPARSLFFSLLLSPCCALAQGIGGPDISCPETAENVRQVDSSRSRAEILVRKAGFLKRFGHDHIVLAGQIEGHVHWPDNLQEACGALTFEVGSLVVDDTAAREKYQLDTKPSAKDIGKTRENMLSKVLESDRWPNVRILLDHAGGKMPSPEVRTRVVLHGFEHEMLIPVQINQEEAGLVFSGAMEITQSDFGIKRFSAFGGGLIIEDKLQIRFTIVVN